MGELFQRYFQLLAGRLPGAEYGVIASPVEDDVTATETWETECPCPGQRLRGE